MNTTTPSAPSAANAPGRDLYAAQRRTSATSAGYTRTAVLLHWLVGIALVAEGAYGLYLREIARGSPDRGPAVNLHKSIGLVIGVSIVVRLAWRLTHRPPPLPDDVPRWQSVAARANHVAMYACMAVIPLAGYAASNFSKYGVRFFGRWTMPPWGPDAPAVYNAFNTLHDAAAWLLAALVALHIAATLKHAWVDRDRPFERLRWRRAAISASPSRTT